MMSYVGVKVVRGPDWHWGRQDGGEGNIGTVYAVGHPAKTAMVKWDNGNDSNYAIGHLEQYDLRMIDNSQTGVIHEDIPCDGCKMRSIEGMRYRCMSCESCSLCAKCYHHGMHSLSHKFTLYITETSSGIPLRTRKNAKYVVRSNFMYFKKHLPVLGKEVRKPRDPLSKLKRTECVVCSEENEKVRLIPCDHKAACENCCARVNVCLICNSPVEKRMTAGGREILSVHESRLEKLDETFSEIEDLYACKICTDEKANNLFTCGHSTCSECFSRLTTCHMCRKHIEQHRQTPREKLLEKFQNFFLKKIN